jgi:hypothetical protein
MLVGIAISGFENDNCAAARVTDLHVAQNADWTLDANPARVCTLAHAALPSSRQICLALICLSPWRNVWAML